MKARHENRWVPPRHASSSGSGAKLACTIVGFADARVPHNVQRGSGRSTMRTAKHPCWRCPPRPWLSHRLRRNLRSPLIIGIAPRADVVRKLSPEIELSSSRVRQDEMCLLRILWRKETFLCRVHEAHNPINHAPGAYAALGSARRQRSEGNEPSIVLSQYT